MPVEPLLRASGPGVPLPSRDWADEFSLFVDSHVSDNLFLRAGGGYGMSDKTVKEAFGSGDEVLFALIDIGLHFSRTRRVGDEKVS
jgi:hypothetical protein